MLNCWRGTGVGPMHMHNHREKPGTSLVHDLPSYELLVCLLLLPFFVFYKHTYQESLCLAALSSPQLRSTFVYRYTEYSFSCT